MFGIHNIRDSIHRGTKVHVISKENLLEHDCSSPCECDEDMKMTKVGAVSDTIWKIGCYKINPSTPSGQKLFILHMLVLPLIPITALVIQNSVALNTLLVYQSRVGTIRRQVRGAMEIAVFIQNIQEERAEVALHIFSNPSDNGTMNGKALTERFEMTDRALEEMPTWPNLYSRETGNEGTPTGGGTKVFKSKLTFQIQHEVFRLKVREGSFSEITSILAWYEFINDIILDHLDDEIKSTNKSGVWRYLISFKNLLRAIENIGIVSVYGIKYLTTGKVTQENFIKYVEHDTLIWEYLNSSVHLAPYLEDKLQNIYSTTAYQFYRESDKVILNNALDIERGKTNVTSTMKYFHSISEYMLELRKVLEQLRDDIEDVAQEELNAADKEKITGIAALTFTCSVTVVFYLFVKNALSAIKIFAKEMMEMEKDLHVERKNTEKAFNEYLPKSILCHVKEKKELAEPFESVTVFYGEFFGFMDLTVDCPADELVDLLNLICVTVDSRTKKFNVNKINNVGEFASELMMISGLPHSKVGNKHVSEIASMALDLLCASIVFKIPHMPNARLQLRMGMHTGSALGIVSGSKTPKYFTIGPTTNIARLIGKMSDGMRIHVSETTKHLLDKVGGFRCDYRGIFDLEEKQCQMETFWLIGRDKDIEENGIDEY